MYQVSELINLILCAFGLLLIIAVLKPISIKRHLFFYIAYLSFLGALTFTVVEGYVWKHFFDLLEHLCYALTGLFLLIGSLSLRRWNEEKEDAL